MKKERPKMELLNNISLQTMAEMMGCSADELLENMQTLQNQKILKQHEANHKIWFQESTKLWITYVPDANKPKGRRPMTAKTKSKLEDRVIAFYSIKKENDSSKALTLREFYPTWLAHKAKIKTKATAERNDKDWRRYYINDPIIDKPMASLSTNDLQEWVCTLKNEYKMDRTQFGNFSSIIRQMFKYAEEEKKIPFNPFSGVKFKWDEDFYDRPEKTDEEQAFFPDEAEKMISYCWDQYHKNRQRVQIFAPLAIVFTFYTGLRLGELVALRFSDINKRSLKVQRMLTADVVVEPRTKKHSKRTVPLTDNALEVIEEVKRKKLELGLPVDGYIFAFDNDYDGDPARLMTRISNSLKDYNKELGLIDRSMHDIRRTFLSTCIHNGLSIKTVSNFAGHKHIQTTEKSYLYDIMREEEKAEALTKALNY